MSSCFYCQTALCEAVLKDTASHKAAETQVWLKFAVKCQYLPVEQGRELYVIYNQVLSGLVNMINNPNRWIIGK
nr:four helix bundle protein [Pleurocapsa sp. CCALA 161]